MYNNNAARRTLDMTRSHAALFYPHSSFFRSFMLFRSYYRINIFYRYIHALFPIPVRMGPDDV